MIEILEFIFRDFWHFIGTIILIVAIGAMIEDIVGAAKR